VIKEAYKSRISKLYQEAQDNHSDLLPDCDDTLNDLANLSENSSKGSFLPIIIMGAVFFMVLVTLAQGVVQSLTPALVRLVVERNLLEFVEPLLPAGSIVISMLLLSFGLIIVGRCANKSDKPREISSLFGVAGYLYDKQRTFLWVFALISSWAAALVAASQLAQSGQEFLRLDTVSAFVTLLVLPVIAVLGIIPVFLLAALLVWPYFKYSRRRYTTFSEIVMLTMDILSSWSREEGFGYSSQLISVCKKLDRLDTRINELAYGGLAKGLSREWSTARYAALASRITEIRMLLAIPSIENVDLARSNMVTFANALLKRNFHQLANEKDVLPEAAMTQNNMRLRTMFLRISAFAMYVLLPMIPIVFLWSAISEYPELLAGFYAAWIACGGVVVQWVTSKNKSN